MLKTKSFPFPGIPVYREVNAGFVVLMGFKSWQQDFLCHFLSKCQAGKQEIKISRKLNSEISRL